MIRMYIILLVAALLVGPRCLRADERPAAFQSQLLALHNQVRANEKLAPLTHNALLAKAAQAHAAHMAATGKFAHEGIGDGTVDSRVDAAGYAWRSLAENIAWGGKDARTAMKTWLDSPPHRMQLLGAYQEVGFGRAVARNGKVYWVACFANPP